MFAITSFGELRRLGVSDCFPADLAHGRVGCRDDGRAGRHRLGDRQAEALVARREDERSRLLRQADELLLRHEAAYVGAAGAQFRRQCCVAHGADDDEPPSGGERRVGGEQRVLAGLDRASEQHVVTAHASRDERGIGGEQRDGDLLRRQRVELDEVVLRPLRDRQHAPRTARRARHDEPKDRRLAATHEPRVALEREVLDSEHGRARQGERQRVHEVRERRTKPAQEERHTHGHTQLLDARRQRDRLDTRRHELGAPRDRGKAQAAAGRGQRAEQVLDVRLVARALPAEHVGVDDDERLAHAAASW